MLWSLITVNKVCYYFLILRKNIPYTDLVYIRFVGYNFKLSHSSRACNCRRKNYTECIICKMFILFLQTRCHMPISSGSLYSPIDVKLQTKEIVPQNNHLNKNCIFFNNLS